MRYALISDIHANMQAWEAVLQDSRIMRCEVILCLGDVVGFGPKPAEVLESVCTHAASIVVGDHDAVIGGRLDSSIFSDDAREVIEWTRSKLTAVTARLFADMEGYLLGDGFVICHSETDEPERFSYIRKPEDARASFNAMATNLIFAGHTHEPGVFTLDPATGAITHSKLLELALAEDKRYYVNVGSVGYPIHGEVLASYAVYDSDARHITFRGVPFDLDAFAADVAATGLPVAPPFTPMTMPHVPTVPPPTLIPPRDSAPIADNVAAIRVPVINPHRRSGPIRYVTPEELRDTTRTARIKKYDSPLLRPDAPSPLQRTTSNIQKNPTSISPQPEDAPPAPDTPSRKKRKPIIIRKRTDTPPKPKIIETSPAPHIEEPEAVQASDLPQEETPIPEVPVIVQAEPETEEKQAPPRTVDSENKEELSEEEKDKLRKERSRQILLAAQKKRQLAAQKKAAYNDKLKKSLQARQQAALKKRKEAKDSSTNEDKPANTDNA